MNPVPLLPVHGAAIPSFLKKQDRWLLWRHTWKPVERRWSKVPVGPTKFPASTHNAAHRWSYPQVVATYEAEKDIFSGIGFIMTGVKGLVGIDMDDCVTDGIPEAWAQEVVDKFDTYTEISPSGKGLRLFAFGEHAKDFLNNTQGIEVYGGNSARYLTITGCHLPGTPAEIAEAPAGALEWVAATYQTQGSKAEATDKPPVPEILDDIPDLDNYPIPPGVRAVLEGPSLAEEDDRSGLLHGLAIDLQKAGLTDVETFSVMATLDSTMSAAEAKRNNDHARALEFLWNQSVLPAKVIADAAKLTDEDFDIAPAQPLEDAILFDDETENAPEKPPAEKPPRGWVQIGEYAAQNRQQSWILRGVLPRGELIGMYGESGAGKSFIALDMLLSLSMPNDVIPYEWMGLPLNKQFRIAYVAAEGAIGVQNRAKAFALARGVDLSCLDFYILDGQPSLLSEKAVQATMKSLEPLGKLDVIVYDTLAQVTPGANENDSKDMSLAIKATKRIHDKTGATVMLIGHSGKDASRGQRGWSGLKGAMDAQLEVTRAGAVRKMTVVKMKDGAGEGSEYPFRLHEVILGMDAEDEPITSMVVEALSATEAASLLPAGKKGAAKDKTRHTSALVEDLRTAAIGVLEGLDKGQTLEYLKVVLAKELPAHAEELNGRYGIQTLRRVLFGRDARADTHLSDPRGDFLMSSGVVSVVRNTTSLSVD